MLLLFKAPLAAGTHRPSGLSQLPTDLQGRQPRRMDLTGILVCLLRFTCCVVFHPQVLILSLSSTVAQSLPALKEIQLGKNCRLWSDDGTWPGKLHPDHNLAIVPSAVWTPSHHHLSTASGLGPKEVFVSEV